MRPFVLTLIGFVGGLAACQSATPETPTQAVEEIVALYEAQDFNRLIRTRYAEISKAESEDQIQALVDRFGRRFADDTTRQQAVDTYRSLLSLTPELSEDGAVATFRREDGFVKLSRMADGRCGFHL